MHRVPRYAGEQGSITHDAFRFTGLLISVAFLANLHRVRSITERHLATTSPPPSILHAGIFASRYRVRQFRSSPIPGRNVLATLSMPTIRRVVRGLLLSVRPDRSPTLREFSSSPKNDEPCTITFWSSASTDFTCHPLRRFKHRFLSSA